MDEDDANNCIHDVEVDLHEFAALPLIGGLSVVFDSRARATFHTCKSLQQSTVDHPAKCSEDREVADCSDKFGYQTCIAALVVEESEEIVSDDGTTENETHHEPSLKLL